MKKFLLKISGAISAFFQKFSKKKKKKIHFSLFQEVYGIPPSMLKELEKEKKRLEREDSIQELYGIPNFNQNKNEDFFKQIDTPPEDRRAQKLYGVPRPKVEKNPQDKED